MGKKQGPKERKKLRARTHRWQCRGQALQENLHTDHCYFCGTTYDIIKKQHLIFSFYLINKKNSIKKKICAEVLSRSQEWTYIPLFFVSVYIRLLHVTNFNLALAISTPPLSCQFLLCVAADSLLLRTSWNPTDIAFKMSHTVIICWILLMLILDCNNSYPVTFSTIVTANTNSLTQTVVNITTSWWLLPCRFTNSTKILSVSILVCLLASPSIPLP